MSCSAYFPSLSQHTIHPFTLKVGQKSFDLKFSQKTLTMILSIAILALSLPLTVGLAEIGVIAVGPIGYAFLLAGGISACPLTFYLTTYAIKCSLLSQSRKYPYVSGTNGVLKNRDVSPEINPSNSDESEFKLLETELKKGAEFGKYLIIKHKLHADDPSDIWLLTKDPDVKNENGTSFGQYKRYLIVQEGYESSELGWITHEDAEQKITEMKTKEYKTTSSARCNFATLAILDKIPEISSMDIQQ